MIRNRIGAISTLASIILSLILILIILSITVPGIRSGVNDIIKSASKLVGIQLETHPGPEDEAGSSESCSVAVAQCQFDVMHSPSMPVSEIERILRAADSPAIQAEPDIAQFFYDESVRTGVDDAVAIAFFKHESTFGKYGKAPITKSIGNIRYTATCKEKYGGENYDGFCKYPSWKAGVTHWYNLIKDDYVGQGYDTLGEILARYAPCDENNINNYIASIQDTVKNYRNDFESACPLPS